MVALITHGLSSGKLALRKMRVFDIVQGDGFELCHPKDATEFRQFANRENWSQTEAPRVRIVRQEYDGKPFLKSDAPFWTSDVLILRENAYSKMASVLGNEAEACKLDCDDGDLIAVRAKKVLDALIEDQSDIARIDDGTVYAIRRYAFRLEVVREVNAMFALTIWLPSPIFVTGAFTDHWHRQGLVGLAFKPIWDSANAALTQES
jgi:hypothetical protein